jgi:hypothetical protein
MADLQRETLLSANCSGADTMKGMGIALLALLLLADVPVAVADAPVPVADAAVPVADAPVPLTVRVGKSVAICVTGTIQCPAAQPICDDTSVVTAEETEAGLVFKGLKPGTTLCSAASAAGVGPRRVYKIEVVEAKK